MANLIGIRSLDLVSHQIELNILVGDVLGCAVGFSDGDIVGIAGNQKKHQRF